MSTVPAHVRSQIPADVLIDVDLRPTILLEMRFTPRRNEKGRAHLEPADKPRWAAFCDRMAKKSKKGEPYNVRALFEHDPGIRTVGANRVLWGMYRYALAALREKYASLTLETGQVHRCPFRHEGQLHEAMKHMILGTDVVIVDGEELVVPATTTTLTRDQFWAFYDRVVRWLGEHGIGIPSFEEMFG